MYTSSIVYGGIGPSIKRKKKFKLCCKPQIEKWGKNVENLHPQASPTKKNWQKSNWGFWHILKTPYRKMATKWKMRMRIRNRGQS